MAGGVDHDHDHQTEDERDAHRSERTAVLAVGDDRATAGEHERERGQPFGRRASPECEVAVHCEVDAKD